MPTFDNYLGTSDPLLHLCQYQDKMAVYTHDDLLLCRAFPSSLKGIAYHWFYLLLRNLLRNFHEVTDAFYNQFASLREFQRNDNHLLTVKMKVVLAQRPITLFLMMTNLCSYDTIGLVFIKFHIRIKIVVDV